VEPKQDKKLQNKKKTGKKRNLILLVLLLLIALLCLLFYAVNKPVAQKTGMIEKATTNENNAAAPGNDSAIGHAAADTPAEKNALAALKKAARKIAAKPAQAKDTAKERDTTTVSGPGDSELTQATRDSAMAKADPCVQDTAQPWVYPDPAGGLHRKKISIRLVPNKPCRIEWRKGDGAAWVVYNNGEIPMDSSGTISYKAVDSCGHLMDARTTAYEIRISNEASVCPQDMEFVRVGTTVLCMDRFEWPNRKGNIPKAYVAYYQAADSCFAVQKRLCTAEEWRLACGGPSSWPYPYGSAYEPHACVTTDTSAKNSGSKPECRGYFDLYDMSGNLAEWTSTHAPQNQNFFLVAGGFWESGSESGCTNFRYSYFPQNRHNPVGFRCCKDINEKNGK
jgi:hypothetical protein